MDTVKFGVAYIVPTRDFHTWHLYLTYDEALEAAGGDKHLVTCIAGVDMDDADDIHPLAAAGDMARALEMMLDKFEHDVEPGEAGWDAVEAARKAIAKAKGESDEHL